MRKCKRLRTLAGRRNENLLPHHRGWVLHEGGKCISFLRMKKDSHPINIASVRQKEVRRLRAEKGFSASLASRESGGKLEATS